MDMEIPIKTEPEVQIDSYNLDHGKDLLKSKNHLDKVKKEPRIKIQSLYCYSCHQNFESLSLFQSHRHGDEDEENSCLEVDLDGLSVTCHKCNCRFQSLRFFLDHLYRKKKRKRRKILQESHSNLHLDSDSEFNTNNNNNKNSSENPIDIDNSQSADFSDSQNTINNNNNYDNEIETDPEFECDPLDLDLDLNEDEINEVENNEDEEFSPHTNSKSKSKSKKQNKNKKDDKDKNPKSPIKKQAVCLTCGKSYSMKYTLYKHIRRYHDPNYFPSIAKSKSFKNSTASRNIKIKPEKIQKKQKIQKPKKPKEYIIIEDDDNNESETTTNSNNNNNNKKKKKKEIKVKCPAVGCGKLLSCAQSLKYHNVIYHKSQNLEESGTPGEKPTHQHKCPQCDKTFALKSYLHNHIIGFHEKRKPVLCHLCPLTFINQAKLMEHLRIHTGEKPFLCTHCPLTFAHRCNLNRHMHTHSTKSLKCDFEGCNAVFRMNQTLKRHKQKHTGWRPYQCKFPGCTTSFMDNKPLKTHYAQAHPDFSVERFQHQNRSQSISTSNSASTLISNQQQQQSDMNFIPTPVPIQVTLFLNPTNVSSEQSS